MSRRNVYELSKCRLVGLAKLNLSGLPGPSVGLSLACLCAWCTHCNLTTQQDEPAERKEPGAQCPWELGPHPPLRP